MNARTTSRNFSGLAFANLVIAIIVWCAGFAFTRQVVPFQGIGPYLPWVLAFIVQVALTIGQANQRTIGWRNLKWPYVVLILVDVSMNALGLLIATQTVQTPGDALLYVLRALTTGVGAWQVLGAILVGALIAALPEELIRDAA